MEDILQCFEDASRLVTALIITTARLQVRLQSSQPQHSTSPPVSYAAAASNSRPLHHQQERAARLPSPRRNHSQSRAMNLRPALSPTSRRGSPEPQSRGHIQPTRSSARSPARELRRKICTSGYLARNSQNEGLCNDTRGKPLLNLTQAYRKVTIGPQPPDARSNHGPQDAQM